MKTYRWFVLSLLLAMSSATVTVSAETEGYEPYSLQEDIAEKQSATKGMIDEHTAQTMQSAEDEVRQLNIPANSPQVGDTLLGFSLPAPGGETVRLHALLEQGPVVVTFYRGGWCPYCQLELQAFERALPEIEALGAALVAISPETLEQVQATSERLGLSFDVLSDRDNQTARAYGLVFALPDALRDVYRAFGIDLAQSNGDDAWELPVPATFVVAQDGTIAARFVDPDYTQRMDPSEVIAALEELEREISN